METKQQLTVVRILALTEYTVSKVTTARQQLSASTAAHSTYDACRVGWHYNGAFCHTSYPNTLQSRHVQ